MTYSAVVLGAAVVAILSGCGGSSGAASPSPTAIRSVNLSGPNGISVAQACVAASGAWSTFNSADSAATGNPAKVLVAAQAADTFAKIAYALSSAALLAPSTTAASFTPVETDAGTVRNDFTAISNDLSSGDTSGAASLISGQLSNDYNALKSACKAPS